MQKEYDKVCHFAMSVKKDIFGKSPDNFDTGLLMKRPGITVSDLQHFYDDLDEAIKHYQSSEQILSETPVRTRTKQYGVDVLLHMANSSCNSTCA